MGHRREQQRLMLLPAPILSHWLLPVTFGKRNDVGQNRNVQGGTYSSVWLTDRCRLCQTNLLI